MRELKLSLFAAPLGVMLYVHLLLRLGAVCQGFEERCTNDGGTGTCVLRTILVQRYQ